MKSILEPNRLKRSFVPLSEHKANSAFELVHCDLWGPYRTPSTCGAFYFLTIVDDYLCVVWVYLLADKREVSTMLHNFFALLERQFHKQVKIFRSDNETKFTCMKRYFLDRGIIFQTSEHPNKIGEWNENIDIF